MWKFAYYCLVLSSPHTYQFLGSQSAAQWEFLERKTPRCPGLAFTITREKDSPCNINPGSRSSSPWMVQPSRCPQLLLPCPILPAPWCPVLSRLQDSLAVVHGHISTSVFRWEIIRSDSQLINVPKTRTSFHMLNAQNESCPKERQCSSDENK